jgi:hypothetical protein
LVTYTTLSDKVCQLLLTDWWSSPVISTNKTDCHDITEILLNVALNTIALTLWVVVGFFFKPNLFLKNQQYKDAVELIFVIKHHFMCLEKS